MGNSMRPGIYASYSMSPGYISTVGKGIGILAASPNRVEEPKRIHSFLQAEQIFGAEGSTNRVLSYLKLLYQNGVGKVYALTADCNNQKDREKQIEKLFLSDDVYLIIGDPGLERSADFLKRRLNELEQAGSEKLLVLGAETVSAAESLAERLNNKRCLLAYPPLKNVSDNLNLAPAALAALISNCKYPAENLNGKEIVLENMASLQAVEEENINQLLKKGVSVFERLGERIELIRGGTTATKNEQGEEDYSLRSLEVVLTVDQVIPTIRKQLKEMMKTARNNQQSMESIASMILCRLEEDRMAGLLAEYDPPRVEFDPDDPTVCIVTVAFRVQQGIQQLYLTVQIAV